MGTVYQYPLIITEGNMLKLILGGAGTGKSSMLINETDKLSMNDKKIIIIVPEQFSFEYEKKLYNSIGAEKFNRILCVSFTTLAKNIFEEFGGRSGEYAADTDKYILMNKAIKDIAAAKDLRFFNKQAKKVTFAGNMLSVVNEFRQSGISPEQLEKVGLINEKSNEKLCDISLIYTAYDRLLKENGLKDSLNDISEAAAVANINDYFEDCIVMFDEFESFTGDELQLIDVIFSQAYDIYITLRLENTDESSDNSGIFDSVRNTYHRFVNFSKKYNLSYSAKELKEPLRYKYSDLAFLNQNILRNKKKYQGSENIHVICCGDLYDEAEYVCSKINELVRDKGYHYRDIAIVSRQLDEYVFILEAAFRRYDIPCFMDVKKNAFHTLIMQLMVNTVNVVCEKDPDTEMLLRYIRSSFSEFSVSDISELENYCFEWGIEGKDWFSPFTNDIDSKPHIENMRKRIIEPLEECRKASLDSGSGQICRNIYKLICNTGIPERISKLTEELTNSGYIFEAKEQKRMWDTLMDILDRFDTIGKDIPANELSDLLRSVLMNIIYSLPPQKLDTVHAAKAETARLVSPKAVFVLGVNEGYFPVSAGQQSLLNEKERQSFKKAGLKLSRDDMEFISDEKLIVYKCLTYASEELYLTYPETDLSGKARYKASVVNNLTDMFGCEIEKRSSDMPFEFFCSTEKAAFYYYVQNYSSGKDGIKEIEYVLSKKKEYSDKISFLKKLAKDSEITVDDLSLMRELFTDKLMLSPTGFEEFNLCHFKFFLDRGLKLKKLRKREIRALEQGNMVHGCLEYILSSCSTKEEFDSLTADDISKLIDKSSDEYIYENMGEKYTDDIRNSNNLKNIKESISSIVLHLQEEFKQSEFRPVEFEYIINKENYPVLKADNGIEIILNGKIDRVDLYEGADRRYIRVVDYKTGKKDFSLAELKYGINMQMLIYLFSITSEYEKYSGCAPAGVLYMPSREISCSRDRDSSEDIEEHLRKQYRMKGVVLKDRMVLSAMEKDIKGIYIPAKVTSKDTGTGEPLLNEQASEYLSMKQFKNLKKFTDNKIKELADKLYSGDIDCCPLYLSNKVCEYCEYSSVCGHDIHGRHREPEGKMEDIKKEFKELLDKEQGNTK